MTWSAEILGDPQSDDDLYIEILEDEVYKCRLQIDRNGILNLTFYGGESVTIPMDWLIEIARKADKDLRS